MITFQTNENNDIFIGKNGNLAISSDLQALIQSCEQAMQSATVLMQAGANSLARVSKCRAI